MIDTANYGDMESFNSMIGLCRTRKGKIKSSLDFFLWRIGFYKRFSVIDFSRVERVIFICTGNVCRSPYAEVSLAKAGIATASFGLVTTPGTPANDRAVQVALKRDVNLRTHRSKQAEVLSIGRSDLLVGMTPGHGRLAEAKGLCKEAQLTLLGFYASPPMPTIADPFNQPTYQFEKCFDVIDSGLKGLSRHLS